MKYRPPFPWFGGKSKAAHIVWKYLGDVDNYVEPFLGSGAVLFMRPKDHLGYVETVNDKDHLIANFWRAVKYAPDEVAKWADNPVNEDDLTARHIWLVKYGLPELDERIPADPDYYNAKIAGWWVWGICCWIGGGFCSGGGSWTEEGGKIVKARGQGVKRQLPHLGNPGQGVNRPEIDLLDYMRALSARLRRVRVCAGDWSRIVTRGALSHGSTVGIFLDPPYSGLADRDDNLYREESLSVAHLVRQWCIENGSNPRYRIALCGYDGEHNVLENLGWDKFEWKANVSYQAHNSSGKNAENRHKERIWFSPHCLNQKLLL